MLLSNVAREMDSRTILLLEESGYAYSNVFCYYYQLLKTTFGKYLLLRESLTYRGILIIGSSPKNIPVFSEENRDYYSLCRLSLITSKEDLDELHRFSILNYLAHLIYELDDSLILTGLNSSFKRKLSKNSDFSLERKVNKNKPFFYARFYLYYCGVKKEITVENSKEIYDLVKGESTEESL